MLLRELFRKLPEGGYDSSDTAVQSTVINPAIVKRGLAKMKAFIDQFNQYLATKGISPVKIGTPTGSSADHDIDPADAIYGDIDLQIIVPELPELAGKTTSQVQSHWYKIEDEFVKTVNPAIHPSSHPGHPILDIGNNEFVQVDMMIHPVPVASWGAARVIPERGVKGLLHGNMFSVLGELLTMSIQHAGVQFKVRDKVKQPYKTTRGKYELVTLSTDPENFVMDIFNHEAEEQGIENAKAHPLLQKHPGKNLQDVKISNLVNAVKGLAYSFELNNMYGKGDLEKYKNAKDFLNQFLANYSAKAIESANSSKFEKVTEPHAVARAQSDKKKILSGLEMVKGLFSDSEEQAVSEAGKRLTKQGIDVSRVNRDDFLHIKSTLNPLLQKAGLTAGWTSGGAGSFDPEHMFGGGGREDSGDVDIMIDPNDLVNNFQIDLEEFNRVAPKPMGPKALANALADPAKVAKLKMVAAKWSLADFLTKNGFPTDPGTLTVQFSRGPINYSVDLIIRPKSAWPLHTHDFTRDPKMRGGDLWNIYPKLAKLASSTTFVDPKTGEEKGNIQYSPDRGLVDRDTNKVVAIDKDAIAKIIIGPEATARDISSLSGLRDVLQRYPEKWAEVEPLFPREEK